MPAANHRHPTQVVRPSDLALAVGLLLVAVLSGLDVDSARPDTVRPGAWWQWALLATPPLLVAVRRVEPIAATVLVTVAQSLIWVSDLPEVLLPTLVILYTVSSDRGEAGRRVAIAAGIVLTGVTAVGVRVAGDVTAEQLPLIALTCTVAIVLGWTAARQRHLAGELAAEVGASQVRAEHARDDAIAAERTHIANELHDSLGHTLAVIAVRAEAADRVADTRPDAPREASLPSQVPPGRRSTIRAAYSAASAPAMAATWGRRPASTRSHRWWTTSAPPGST